MPIVAIAQTQPDIPNEIALRMTKTFLQASEWENEGRSARHFTVNVVNPSWQNSSKRVVYNGNIILAFDGRIHKRNERGLMSAETLLDLYVRHGVSALYALNGLYVILIWDKHRRSLTLVNDRHGFRKLYYCVLNGMLILSTQMKAIVKIMPHKPRIDELAVAQFLSMGYPMGNRTMIKGIKRISPATVLTYNCHGIRESHYWNYSILSDSALTLDDSASLLAGVIKKSVERSVASFENLVLPCTGGLDSRILAGFVGQMRNDVVAYSYGHRHTYDVRYGRKIARAVGFKHKFLPLPDKYIEFYYPQAMEINEGEVCLHTAHICRLNQAGPKGAGILTGFIGDVLSGKRLYENFDSYEGKIKRFLQTRYLTGFSGDELGLLFKKGIGKNLHNEARDFIKQSFDSAQATSFEDKSVIVDLMQRQRRFITYHLDLLSRNFYVETPFTYPDVVDTFFRIPLNYRINQKAYVRMIVKYLPVVAEIKNDKTEQKISQMEGCLSASDSSNFSSDSSFSKWLYLGLKWRVERLSQTLNIKKSLRHPNVRIALANLTNGWFGDHDRKAYAHYDEIIHSSSKDFFKITLSDYDYLSDMFDVNEVKRLLDEHLMRKSNHFEKIHRLATFVQFRKFFNI